MCQRNARIAGYTRSCCYARHHLKRNTLDCQCLQLLATTTKDERVAALEPDDLLSLQSEFDQQCIDLLLAHRVLVAALARINTFRSLWDKIQHCAGNQVVIHHHVSLFQQAHGAQR